MAGIGQFFGIFGMAVGAFVGYWLGNPYAGAMIGGAIGGMIGAYFFPEGPKMKNQPPPEPGEGRVQVSSYGAMIPKIWGAKRIAGNIIWMDDIKETRIRERHRQDGVRYYENERVFTCSFAIAFCEGVIDAIKRIWVNNELFVDFRVSGDPYYTPTGDSGANYDESNDLYNTYFTIYYGTESQTIDPTMEAVLGTANTCPFRGICYIVFRDFPVGKIGSIPSIEIEAIRKGLVWQVTDSVSSVIISEICSDAGLTSSDIDVTDVASSYIAGYGVMRQMEARNALEPILQLMRIEVAEIDWELHFTTKFDSTSVVSISSDELGAKEDSDGEQSSANRFREVRVPELEMPNRLTMNYESRERDYDTVSMTAFRIDRPVSVPMTISIGVVIADQMAKRHVETLLRLLWHSRVKFYFSTNIKYLYLNPSNIITVGGKEMRAIEMTDRGGIIDFVCEGDEGGAYDTEALSDDLHRDPPSLTARYIIPNVLFIESPFRFDWDSGLGFYVAFYTNDDDEYSGGALRISYDDEYSWATIAHANRQESAKVGMMQEAFDGSGFNVDMAVSGQTLVSGTDLIAAIGDETNGWEIINFDTVALVSGTTYAISSITRGLYGTKTHGAGEFFVLLTGEVSIDKVFLDADLVDVEMPYQPVSRALIGGATPKYFTFTNPTYP